MYAQYFERPRPGVSAPLNMSVDGDYYYHYSTRENIAKIIESGEIQPSTNTTTDAILGKGVYFTSKPPQCSNSTLTKNNYDADADTNDPRVQSYIRIPKEQLPNVVCLRKENGRDVCVNPGGPIDLSKVNYKAGDRKRYESPGIPCVTNTPGIHWTPNTSSSGLNTGALLEEISRESEARLLASHGIGGFADPYGNMAGMYGNIAATGYPGYPGMGAPMPMMGGTPMGMPSGMPMGMPNAMGSGNSINSIMEELSRENDARLLAMGMRGGL